MKKRIGICFFIGTLCAVVVAQGALLFAHEYNKRQENAEMSAERKQLTVVELWHRKRKK